MTKKIWNFSLYGCVICESLQMPFEEGKMWKSLDAKSGVWISMFSCLTLSDDQPLCGSACKFSLPARNFFCYCLAICTNNNSQTTINRNKFMVNLYHIHPFAVKSQIIAWTSQSPVTSTQASPKSAKRYVKLTMLPEIQTLSIFTLSFKISVTVVERKNRETYFWDDPCCEK